MVNEFQLRNLIADTFNVSIDDISADSNMDNVKSWDSIKHMNLIIALEEAFDIEIPDDDAANITSYTLIKCVVIECLERKT